MLSLRLIVIYFVLGITSKYMVEALQCYVCEDCNEYEDFKELHICGEISPVTTMKPVTLPEIIETPNNNTKTTIKPVHEDTEEYIYDDSMEAHDDSKDEETGSGSSHNNKRTKTRTEIRTTTKPTTTAVKTATAASTTAKPLPVIDDGDYLEYDLPNAGQENIAEQAIKTETTKTANPTTPTIKPTVKQQETTTYSTLTVTPSSSSASSTTATITATSLKPLPLTGDDDYLEYDLTNTGEDSKSEQLIPTNKPIVKQPETTTHSTLTESSSSSSIETKPSANSKPSQLTGDDDYLDYDLTSWEENPASINKPPVKQEETAKTSTSVPSTTSAKTDVAIAPSSKPIQLTAEDDYLEYDVPSAGEQRTIQKISKYSLLKMNEPVCYMIKYNVNNTVITNRGCTTFINANNYLTCQSLYNGAPMNGCRICSSDGCNKFLSDDGSDEDHGIIYNTAGIPHKFSIFVVLLFTILSSIVV